MDEELTDLEMALGGPLTRKGERALPGITSTPGLEVAYVQDDGRATGRAHFRMLLNAIGVPSATDGGIVSDPATIRTPDGRLLRAVSYRGDVNGWRSDVMRGADDLDLLLGRIVGDQLVLSDGSVFQLSECEVHAE